MRYFISLLFIIVVGSCGPDSNILNKATSSKSLEAFDIQLSLARVYYDQGEYSKALKHAELAYEQNPNSESAAVILGFVYIAKAGITPFSIVEKLQAQGKEEAETEDESSTADDDGDTQDSASTSAGEEVDPNSSDPNADSSSDPNSEVSTTEEGEAPAETSKNTGDTLAKLGNLMGLTEADFALMGELDTSVPSIPILKPVCAGEARDLVDKLYYVNRAIAVICPFVDSEVRLKEEQRHDCTETLKVKKQVGNAHFLWAVAHLTEALAFHTIVSYATIDPKKTNLELRVDRVKEFKVKELSELKGFIDEVNSLSDTIAKVLPVVDLCSVKHPQTQLAALVNDMLSVSLGFKQLAGIPEEMTKSIQDAMSKIEKVKESANGASGGLAQTQALKGDLTKKFSETLSKKISSVDTSTYTPEQVTNVCSAYANISGNQENDPNKPKICK